ncbi:quinone oxidoreductase-like [Cimex lectularius]|uniref:Enoyl reductase (ER) domain-containing protein n=1 Tax=Cimex lectularius TaxID=79782 RepID=A0A8I6RFB8_CIMLE|nr:quinone oxidoreductase-like [Cimex lectularius]
MSLPALPLILGKEVSGIIEAVGPDVSKFKEGDHVTCCLPGNGGYADYVTCEQNRLISIPSNISYVQSSCLYVSYFAAIRALITKCKIKKGELLLVHGASGGVGTAAVQIAKSRGLTVIGTAGSKLGEEIVKKAGADLVFNHKKEGYLADVYTASGSKGFDVILENCADTNLGEDLIMLSKSGRIAIVGTRGSMKNKICRPKKVEINPRSLMFTEGSIYAANLMKVTPEEFDEYSNIIVSGIKENWLNPIVGREFKFAQAPEAHRRIREVPAAGKLVFNVEL